MMMYDSDMTLVRLTPSNDPVEDRRVWMQELPNPMMNLTWDTPGVNDTITDAHSIPLSEDGGWCFQASSGLWRIWHDLSPDEVERGVLMNQHDIKALVQNKGMDRLYFQQINLQISGKISCTKKEFCLDLPITIQEVGVSSNRPVYTTKIQSDGTFKFNLVKQGKWDVMIEPNRYCYKENTKRVILGNKNSVKDVDFYMTGMKIAYKSTHSFTGLAKSETN